MNILEARRRTLGGHILKKTAQGNPAIANDSLARMYPGIEMQGWTEQDGTPTPENPVPIVSAGTWDETAQKWEYEITITNAQTDPDKNQTVTLTADRPLTKWDKLTKKDGVWGWVYKSGSYTATGEEGFRSASEQYHGSISSDAYFINNEMMKKPSRINDGYCEYLRYVSEIWSLDNYRKVGFTYNNDQNHIRLSNTDTGVTAEDTLIDVANKIKAYVGQRYQEEKPFVFWYETAAETFVPLTETEQEAMNALYTYRPTTVISNDQNCEMELTYKTRKSMEVTA